MLATRLVPALLVAMVGTAAAAPTKLETVLTTLGPDACGTTVSELEPAFGPINYQPKKDEMANLDPLELPLGDFKKLGVTKISVQLLFDIYHQTPSQVKDPRVGGIVLTLDPKVDLDKIVGALPGASKFTVGTTTVWHAGNVYYRRGLVTITCGNPPAWAQVQWSARTTKDITDRVMGVLDGKPGTGYVKDPKEPGRTRFDNELVAIGRQDKWVYFNFKTPMPAGALLKALGATRVVLRAHDSHRSHWQLEHADGKPIVYRGWRMSIDVDDDQLEKSNSGPALDIDKLLVTNINAHAN